MILGALLGSIRPVPDMGQEFKGGQNGANVAF